MKLSKKISKGSSDAIDKRPAKNFVTIPKKDAFGKFECGYLQGNHRKVTKCRLFGASKRRVVTFESRAAISGINAIRKIIKSRLERCKKNDMVFQ